MEYFEVRKEAETTIGTLAMNGQKEVQIKSTSLAKDFRERLLAKGFEETPTHFRIPLSKLTQKNWKSVMPIAS